ncbi:MAG TPA: cytochrome c oxidase subunit II [Phycisphaerae bacterium]|nr:cytochrome c oxidase subunit II [Phycisphaerae bacterium]HPU27089.1 cytochrome c oxidase subunit II [Phycisphaerae bacterium]HPZ99984.1 cytochrome c oxidase subunit II [Phycisphaerae bacterium]HQE30268.1 cytochrome c oxidase subunit II [Phycisphaerae bacterium]
MIAEFRLFPESASSISSQVDHLFFYLVAVTGFFVLLIFVLILYFAIRYRRTRAGTCPPVASSNRLELTWTVIPLMLALTMFFWGARLYVRMFDPPADAMDVYVIGRQWMWKIQHPEGRREINELHVPLGRPVKLIMSSQDVIHSFYVPAFRIKHDVIPGRYSVLWFEATKLGTFDLFCAEYCGTNHSRMTGKVVVMPPADYEAWLAGTVPDESPARVGAELFRSLGCATCHGQQAPTLAGLYNRQVQLADGSTVLADTNYLRESIMDSTAKIVAGFAPVMPSYRGQLSEEQLIQLIEYIKSLQDAEQAPVHRPAIQTEPRPSRRLP